MILWIIYCTNSFFDATWLSESIKCILSHFLNIDCVVQFVSFKLNCDYPWRFERYQKHSNRVQKSGVCFVRNSYTYPLSYWWEMVVQHRIRISNGYLNCEKRSICDISLYYLTNHLNVPSSPNFFHKITLVSRDDMILQKTDKQTNILTLNYTADLCK